MISEPLQKVLKSPLRYPGGKGAFYPYFSELIKKNDLTGSRYFEPFAGGSGVALGLLSSNLVSEICLNDADYHIYSFWNSVLEETERFIDKIQHVAISIEEWKNQKRIYSDPKKYSVFDVGFSTFYLNRCNRSGILSGAGPIGGYEQKGEWDLGVRFNKKELAERILSIGTFKDRISVKNLDAICFLKKCLPRGKNREKIFIYIDPPYVSAGNRLYLNFYSEDDHKALAQYLIQQINLNWIVTYDDSLLIRGLYSSCQRWIFTLGYSLQSKQKGTELLIAPKWVQMTDKNKLSTTRWNIVGKLRRIEK